MDGYHAKVSVQTFKDAMLQHDIVAVAFVPIVYFLDDTGQHSIDIGMVALQVDAVMKGSTIAHGVFSITIGRSEFQEVKGVSKHSYAD